MKLNLKQLFRKCQAANWRANEAKNAYLEWVTRDQNLDVQCTALDIMLHGIRSLTKEANERHFFPSLQGRLRHMRQLRPVAETIYEQSLNLRRSQPVLTKAAKNKWRRIEVEANRMWEIYRQVEFELKRRYRCEHPDGNWHERDLWVYDQTFVFTVDGDCWSNLPGKKPGFHATVDVLGTKISV